MDIDPVYRYKCTHYFKMCKIIASSRESYKYIHFIGTFTAQYALNAHLVHVGKSHRMHCLLYVNLKTHKSSFVGPSFKDKCSQT